MHIISKKKIDEFIRNHPDAKSSLESWFKILKNTEYSSFNELRQTFAKADHVGKFTVFDIAGNKYRLIVAVHYNRRKVYIRHILTHSEYDRGDWKRD